MLADRARRASDVFNISNFTCEDNPLAGSARRDTWTAASTTGAANTGASTTGASTTGAANTGAPTGTAGTIRRLLTNVSRQLGDRLFAMNDAEASWRGWYVRKERAGLSRTYRHPMFDRLAVCLTCRGTGTDTGMACIWCDASGRVMMISAEGVG